jgi:CRISPR-associated protein Cmr1
MAMGMTETSYTVRFVTPAFLGDADQKGRWRTPPFKALIRQWWPDREDLVHHGDRLLL